MPTPGSPTSVTSCGRPSAAARSSCSSSHDELARAADERRSRGLGRRAGVAARPSGRAPGRRRHPASPWPRRSPARRTRRRLRRAAAVLSPTSTCPGRAACSSRAVTLTGSPVANELPSRGLPMTTSPVFTPIRSASRSPKSSVQTLLHPQRNLQRPLGVILLRRRCAEDGDDRVTDELLDGAAPERDLGRHRVVEAIEQVTRMLRIEGPAEFRRADEIREEEGCELPLTRGGLRLGRGRARRAEPCTLRQSGSADSAGLSLCRLCRL